MEMHATASAGASGIAYHLTGNHIVATFDIELREVSIVTLQPVGVPNDYQIAITATIEACITHTTLKSGLNRIGKLCRQVDALVHTSPT